MDEFLEALAASKFKSARENRKFISDFDRDVAQWVLQPEDMRFLQLITTGQIAGRPLLSNFHVRRAAQEALVEALPREYEKSPHRQYLWITLACDIGVTWEHEPHLDAESLCNVFNMHLRRCGLHGFGQIEIDTWKLIAGEPSRRIVPHVHFVGWPTNNEPIKIKAFAAELCARRALTNSLGARPVVVKNIRPTAADFMRIGSYMSKSPAYAKNPVPKLVEGGFDLKGANHAPGSVSRLIEILSRLEVGDVMFSIGEGKSIAKAVRGVVAKEVRVRPGSTPTPTQDQVMRHWRRIGLNNGNPTFGECTVITRRDQG
jgi:hypothetical protein